MNFRIFVDIAAISGVGKRLDEVQVAPGRFHLWF